MAALPLPLLESAPLAAPRARDLCTDCGVSRSAHPERCGRACQFIHPRYEALETAAHGRPRAATGDEQWFGPFLSMHRATLAPKRAGAQWTGITTRLAERLLELGLVDAVLATAADPADRWAPRPVLVTEPEGMAACRGMKMGFSPVLALLDEAAARGFRRLAVIGIPCQVHALRALEAELGLERLYVIGTPCSDNTTTANFHRFVALLTDRPEALTFLEFMPDYHVELRFDDGSERRIPFIQLPLAQLPADFMPLTCRSCFDYANALADVTVGYMAGEGDQWLVVRNERGRELVAHLGAELRVRPLGTHGARAGAVKAFLGALERTADGLPARRAPQWLRPIIGRMMTWFGPRGAEFARTRVEMKVLEGIVTLRRHRPHRLRRMVPAHAWALAAPYGITPGPREGAGAPEAR
jgi:coenzyme F420 hydrogenase subunit beta